MTNTPSSMCVAIAAVTNKHSAPLKFFFLLSDQVECKHGKKMCKHVHTHVMYLGRREAIWKLKLYQDDSLKILL